MWSEGRWVGCLMMPGDARVGMAGAVARVARAALRAAGSENWGVRARSMVMRVGDGHAGHEGTLGAASRSSFPVAESPSLRPEVGNVLWGFVVWSPLRSASVVTFLCFVRM